MKRQRYSCIRGSEAGFRAVLTVIACAALTTGCFGDFSSKFPKDLEPVDEANLATPPEGSDDDPFPQKISLLHFPTAEYYVVHGAGYVHANINDVYSALQEPSTVVDYRKVDKWSVELAADDIDVCNDLPKEIEHCFRIHNTVNDLITVEFEITHRMGVIEEKQGTPELIVGKFKKTWGTETISLLESSWSLSPVNERITEFRIEYHLDAFLDSEGNAKSYVQDLYENVVAVSNEEPLPTY